MYYKLKSIGKGFKLIGKVRRIGLPDDGYLYFTQEEMDKFSPDAIDGYDIESKTNKKSVR